MAALQVISDDILDPESGQGSGLAGQRSRALTARPHGLRRAITAGLAAAIARYRANEAWWAPQKDATEATYRATGQA